MSGPERHPTRCIIAGSRDGVRYSDVEQAVRNSGWEQQIATVLCGGARGADHHGAQWAERHLRYVERHPVTDEEWRRLGPRAGPLRNRRMAAAADALILVWDGKSPGSRSMLFEARQRGLLIHVHRVVP